jgi:nucleoside-diphosphate-sugar epimerase
MNILITGSSGLIGKLITEGLGDKYSLTCLDRKGGVDILTDPLGPYFTDIDTMIHLAANPSPFIDEEEADKNVQIAKNLINASRKYGVGRIINASSINVYPYMDLFKGGEKLTRETGLSPNLRFADGSYARAKIKVEGLFEKYCKEKKIPLLNLRLGCVTPDDMPSRSSGGHVNPVDYKIHLKHKDLIDVFKKGLSCKGISSYVCVSEKDGFVDDSVRFPI